MKFIVFYFIILALSIRCVYAQEYASVIRLSAWLSKPVSVCWENADSANKIARDAVKDAIQSTWEKECGIKFSCWCDCQANTEGIRIKFDDVRPETLVLGRKLNGKKAGITLNYQLEKWGEIPEKDKLTYTKIIAVHEFGHAIGFAHEHTRKDCKICFDEPRSEKGDWEIGPCDSLSVMNYCNINQEYLNNGKLSALDIKGAIALYGPPEKFSLKQADELKDVDYSGVNLLFNSSKLKRTKSWIFWKRTLTHQFRIYITAQDEIMNNISEVVYEIQDESFKDPSMRATSKTVDKSNKSNRFGISLLVYDDNIPIIANVMFKDKTVKPLKTVLTFQESQYLQKTNSKK